ncbi:MAG: Gfo/Idh/MocA family oxidoreductase [Thermoguttaceae bacterium]|nr:Gfo/Idh/MocA family oxidoreductase [Thermoguttaceae bacterium]MDW8038187.1 Gfo/Idh/MocA family oxidoreductase [Thermoguttaceae bacterium]
MSNKITRRQLVQTGLGVGLGGLVKSGLSGAAGAAVGWAVLPARLLRAYAANEKVQVALIGVGGRGRWFVETIPKMADLVALCDVNDLKVEETFRFLDETSRRWADSPHPWERQAAEIYRRLAEKKPPVFADFRKMLQEMGAKIDAVVVATPDHTHAVASAAAIRSGKHVFCEKPLTRTVHESRTLRDLARQYKVATAMGNQGTYSGPFRRALELIRTGALGQIREVYIWNDAGGADRREPPKGEMPVPKHLHWDLWLGPAAYRPFHSDWLNRNLWREFGTGQLGNWASHTANLAFMALEVHRLWSAEAVSAPAEQSGAAKPSASADASAPAAAGRSVLPGAGQTPSASAPPKIRIRAETSGVNRLSFPRWEKVYWEIPARGKWPPITFQWLNGPAPGLEELLKPIMQDAPEKQRGLWHFAGTLIVGEKGSIHTTGHNMWFRLLPADRFTGVQTERPETVPASRGPEQDWLAACRGGEAPWSQFDYAAALNEFLMLGNIATQFEQPIEYDPLAMKITNLPEADQLLRSEYRPGWSL